jgi:hypothetical protein
MTARGRIDLGLRLKNTGSGGNIPGRLAKLVGVTASTISRWKQPHYPSLPALVKWPGLAVDLTSFFEDRQEGGGRLFTPGRGQ